MLLKGNFYLMPSEQNSNSSANDLDRLKELPEFREMKMRAEAAEAKLRRIYGTPIWKISKPIRKIYARAIEKFEKKKEEKFVFKISSNDGVPVIDLIKTQVKVEAENANLENKSIAIIAHFSNKNAVSESLTRYLVSLLDCNYSVVLASACESSDELVLDPKIKSKITILRKPNLGYDFGSWAIALDRYPEIFSAERLLLTNDSLIGPLDDISKIISALENSDFDITGVTDNSELQYHIQSYLMLLKPTAIKNLNVQNLLKSIVHLELKNEVILKYELGLTRVAQLSGLFVGSLFSWNLLVQPGKNPSLVGWKRLIELGFPFLKREAVRKGSHSEVSDMKTFISKNFQNSEWAIAEIKSIT